MLKKPSMRPPDAKSGKVINRYFAARTGGERIAPRHRLPVLAGPPLLKAFLTDRRCFPCAVLWRLPPSLPASVRPDSAPARMQEKSVSPVLPALVLGDANWTLLAQADRQLNAIERRPRNADAESRNA